MALSQMNWNRTMRVAILTAREECDACNFGIVKQTESDFSDRELLSFMLKSRFDEGYYY